MAPPGNTVKAAAAARLDTQRLVLRWMGAIGKGLRARAGAKRVYQVSAPACARLLPTLTPGLLSGFSDELLPASRL